MLIPVLFSVEISQLLSCLDIDWASKVYNRLSFGNGSTSIEIGRTKGLAGVYEATCADNLFAINDNFKGFDPVPATLFNDPSQFKQWVIILFVNDAEAGAEHPFVG